MDECVDSFSYEIDVLYTDFIHVIVLKALVHEVSNL